MASASILKHKRILLTRPEEQAQAWADELRSLGAEPVIFPLIHFKPVESSVAIEQAIGRLGNYDRIIFTSTNSVRFFLYALGKRGIEHKSLTLPPVAAIGPVTAACLQQQGIAVDLVPEQYSSVALPEVLGDVAGKKILLPTTTAARGELALKLKEMGAEAEEVAFYETLKRTDGADALLELLENMDVLTFASPSAVEAFKALVPKAERSLVACIGPSTAERAEVLDMKADIIAEKYTMEGLTEAMINYFENEEQTKKIKSK